MPDRGNGRIGYDLFIALDLLELDGGGGDGGLCADLPYPVISAGHVCGTVQVKASAADHKGK